MGLFRFENGDDDDENVVVVIIFIFFVLLKAVVGRLKRRERERKRGLTREEGEIREREKSFPTNKEKRGRKNRIFFLKDLNI